MRLTCPRPSHTRDELTTRQFESSPQLVTHYMLMRGGPGRIRHCRGEQRQQELGNSASVFTEQSLLVMDCKPEHPSPAQTLGYAWLARVKWAP